MMLCRMVPGSCDVARVPVSAIASGAFLSRLHMCIYKDGAVLVENRYYLFINSFIFIIRSGVCGL